ncbi:MAG: S24/S26 family peptidase [Muribaculaceae bacterium]|nr:S24/S26 family peptidase [Muribaculaceae bacterium]
MNDIRNIDNDILLREVCVLLSQGKTVKLRAKGNSMRPFINGSKDILVLTPAATLHKYDVVLARIDGKRYVVHRIIGINGNRITLMGDSNLYGTEECSRSDIFGTVKTILHNGKEHSLTSPAARLYAIAWRFLLPLRRAKQKISNIIK